MIDAQTPDAEHPGADGTTRGPGEPKVLVVTVPAHSDRLPGLRRRLGRWLADRGVAEDLRADIVLACDEAVANAIEHGYAGAEGSVSLTAAVHPDSVTLVVVDRGAWRPRVVDPASPRGWGLRMIEALADSVRLTHSDSRTTLTARFGVSPPADEG
ncbi:ATP-binding protein [Actinokineospora sp. G85]|uniref:ATP-binding protein n=1 Tax=Actinokineospora sp. G85 TaxID=3406626 RepID=UPI003C722270